MTIEEASGLWRGDPAKAQGEADNLKSSTTKPNPALQSWLGKPELGTQPGSYPLRSPQSRAAARALLERRFAGRKRLDIVFPTEIHDPILGEWTEGADGTLIRRSFLPPGMTLREAKPIVSQRGWKPNIQPWEQERELRPIEPEW